MIAQNLVSNDIIPLSISDTGDDALSMMGDFYVRHLPIVSNNQLLGLISEDDILNHDVEEPIGSYYLTLNRPYVNANDHIYEAMRAFVTHQLSIIPVVSGEGNYTGVILLEDILKYFAESASFAETGGTLVLEINKIDYSLSEISRIVESEGASILSSFITTSPNSSRIEVTLKLNRQNLQPIIATFVRYDYSIKASFNETSFNDSLKDRYDSLITYLNV